MRPILVLAALMLCAGAAQAAAPASQASALLEEAQTLAGAGKPTEAIAKLRQLVRDEPANAAAHNMLGSLLNSGGHYAEALPHAEKAVELAPVNMHYRYNRGVVRAEHGRFAEAVADFDAALAAHPDLTYAWLERGAAKLSLDDLQGARSDWAKAAQSDPKLIWPHWYEATGDFVEGRFAEASAGFDRVAKAEPDFVQARLWSALAHGRAGTPSVIEDPGSADWPTPILRYLRDETDEAALLRAAGSDRLSGDRRRTGEAYFFLGQQALIREDRAAAREFLREALAIPSPRHVWRIAAEHDLKQLEALSREGSRSADRRSRSSRSSG